MIIPQYWAEGRIRQRTKQGQFTARRFGWSDESQAAAQAMADQRAQETMARLLAGENLLRREPKVSYNGAEGVPIREEVIRREGEAVITRNSYGALCLNHPSVLFADIDFDDELGFFSAAPIIAIIAYTIWYFAHPHIGTTYALMAALPLSICAFIVLTPVLEPLFKFLRGGNSEKRAGKRIAAFVQAHPDWHLRQYRTPAGFRLLALHRTFSPTEPDVLACFQALGVDKRYALMCQKQQCFRARVSPKPWRVGISQHMKPRPGTWPVNPARLPDRNRWIEAYEQAARGYASCRFVAAMGSASVDPAALSIQQLHDDLCHAESTLPLA